MLDIFNTIELLELASVEVYISDESGSIVYANQIASDNLQYSKDELCHMKISDINPNYPVDNIEKTATYLKKEKSFSIDSLHQRKDKSTYAVTIFISLLIKDEKNYFLAFASDASSKIALEKKLAESQEFSHNILDAIQAGISIIDKDFNVVQTNTWLNEIYKDKTLIGQKCHRVYQGLDEICPFCPTIKCFETGEVTSETVPYPNTENPEGWLELSIYPIKDKEGKVINAIEYIKDITDQVKAKEDLLYQKRFFKTVVETIPHLIWLKDIDGVYLACNPRFERFFGAKEADILGKTDYDFVDKELADFFREHDKNAMRQNRPTINEEWITYADDGHSELLKTTKTPMYDHNNQLVGVLGVAYDITQIRQNEQRLQYALNGANDGLWDWNIESNEVYYSPRWFEMLGYHANELTSSFETWEKLVHPDDIVKAKEKIQEYIEGKSETFDVEFRMLHKDGSYKHILSRAKFTQDQAGEILKPLRLVGTHVDITDIKQYEKALYDKSQKLSGLFDVSPVGIALTDMQGKYIEFNNAFERICGYTKEELNQLDYWQLTPEEYSEQEAEQLKSLEATGFYGPYEKEYIQKSGKRIDIRLNGMIITDSNNDQFIWSLVEDISDQKAYEKALDHAKQQAEKASQAKSDFLANMSHEIRTPMTGMLGFVERLSKNETDPQKRKQFHTIQSSAETLLAVINDILDFSKIENDKLDIEHIPIVPHQIFSEIIEIFTHLADSKGVTLSSDIASDLPACIYGDKIRLKQVIFNLLSNAIKFTKEAGEVTLHATYQSKKIYIAVSDTGIGISQEKIESIFEAFNQEDTSTTRKFGGTGLGLSISTRLVELMGATLKVQSVVSEGSTFYFELPAELCETAPDTSNESEDMDHTLSGHVLIVEDNKTNQMLLSMLLDDFNISYDITNDGAEAVLNYKKHRYDLILMDENMPIMNGIEATLNIRKIEKQMQQYTPIIAVTANALREDKKRFLDVGMDDYVSKPYSEDDIFTILKKYLAKKLD